MIDTHCHLDVARFDEDRDHVLSRAWAAGLVGLIIPAIDHTSWPALVQWPAIEPRVQVGLGLHPLSLDREPQQSDAHHLAVLDAQLSQGMALAVGECGLDGTLDTPMERQLQVFHAHVELARKHRLPLLVHCYRAHAQLQQYFKAHDLPEAGILMHSYSGSAELTPFYVSYGCHFSFAGPLSFPKARKPVEALRRIPLDRLMVETDAPDQSPYPIQGQRNEPRHLPLIVDAMKHILQADIASLTTENARRFFRYGFDLR
jgi:TatD DNase family protein